MTKTAQKKNLNANFQKLNYIFLRQEIDSSGLAFSFRPKDSDFGPHETVLSNLIGTLVKPSASGELVPYLAESFRSSSDGLTWTFKMRKGLVCEDGSVITAESFARRFNFSLRQYSKSSRLIDFELIEGWGEFTTGSAEFLKGISFTKEELIFKLTAKAENFIGHLRLPYFGYWCESNFDSDGEFMDDQRIVSSGPYRLTQSRKNTAVLEARKEWFSWEPQMPKSIAFMYSEKQEIKGSDHPTIIEILGRDKSMELPSFAELKSAPSLMWSMVVSSEKEGPFTNRQNRQAFSARVAALKHNSSLYGSPFFYPSAPAGLDFVNEIPEYSSEMKGYVVRFAFANRNYTYEEVFEIKRMATEALRDSGATIEFYIDDPLKNNWRHRLLSNKEFDIRMNGVDLGRAPTNRNMKMMFCSNLGVCFPDPSGRICRLVARQDHVGGSLTEAYMQEFNQVLSEDAAVIPLTHFGTTWLVSPEVDVNTLSVATGTFCFEGMRRGE